MAGAHAVPHPELRPADAETILQQVRSSDADLIVVNVWATWCLPCREEFPDLLRLRSEFKDRGLDLLLVSGDFSDDREEQVGAFLSEQGVDFVTYLKEGNDMEFIDTLSPQWSGALPVTLFFDSDGVLQLFWEGKASYAKLKRTVKKLMPKKEKS
jgi:thiol-disulfide isomerase/thioredoxin